eukprot:4388659-Alexandrium_andersonii.AAC.1
MAEELPHARLVRSWRSMLMALPAPAIARSAAPGHSWKMTQRCARMEPSCPGARFQGRPTPYV